VEQRQPHASQNRRKVPATSNGHRLVEHTADIGISFWGATPADLFREAALGLLEVMLGPVHVSGNEALQIELHRNSLEELLVAWLNELLFQFEIRGFLPGAFVFEQIGPNSLRVRLTGGPYDAHRWPLERQVKAATYHQLQIERQQGGWQATVYLDL